MKFNLSLVYGETIMALKANLLSYVMGSVCAVFIAFAGLLSTSTAQETPPAARQQQKRIQTLAVVNRQEITRQQIASECMRRFGSDVLQSIVNKFLVAQECQRNGVLITEGDVNDEIVARAQKFGMSSSNYIKTICGKRDISVDRLKNDIIWNDLALRRLAANNIQVTPQEINERMEFEFGAKVQIRQIVVNSLQLATQLREQVLATPENFERLAKQFSVDPNSQAIGGLLPPIRRNSGLPEFENIAFALKPGEVSTIFPLAEKFIIMRCERLFPAETLTSEQTAMVHERIVEEISNVKMADSASALFAKLQKTTKITNVMNDPKLSRQFPGVAAIVNGSNILKNQVGEDCITRYGADMLETEINRSILIQALKQHGVQVEQSDINAEIARAAESRGQLKKDGTVNIDQWLAMVTNNDLSKVEFYIEDEVWPTVALKKLVEAQVAVTDEDMKKAFEANYGPRVEVLAIVSQSDYDARKVWNMASANLSAEYFGQLAHQYSIEPASKNNYGVVPPIQQHGGRPQLEAKAFALKIGEISVAFQVGEHFIILYCLGRTEPVVTDFDVVKEELHKNILEKKMRIAMVDEFQNLRADAQIDNFLNGTSQPGRDAVRSARQLQEAQSGRNGQAPVGRQRR